MSLCGSNNNIALGSTIFVAHISTDILFSPSKSSVVDYTWQSASGVMCAELMTSVIGYGWNTKKLYT
eukprot:m.233768 g.233768  ORF g.233768 m.233768 type:complete len:67 (-) comp16029_c0_seq8:1730-1930(-)